MNHRIKDSGAGTYVEPGVNDLFTPQQCKQVVYRRRYRLDTSSVACICRQLAKEKRMDEIITAREIAAELHCSKAQAYKLMNGTVKGCTKLPSISIGRKRVVRRTTFKAWQLKNESVSPDGLALESR